MLNELIKATRSCRRFKENQKITEQELRELVDLARLSASAANQQPLKYAIACESGKNSVIFGHLAWAAALKDWDGPAEGERPAAYIVILGDTRITEKFGIDHGIAAQTISLGAREKGYGACMIGSIRREDLARALKLSASLEILLVIAIGVPGEEIVIEDAQKTGSVTYYRDRNSVHHVPKRPLDEVIVAI